MFLFPVIYITSFLYGLFQLYKKKVEGFLLFTIVGLPVYINALSVSFVYGLSFWIPVMQSFKEVIVLLTCLLVASQIKTKPKLHRIDILILVFLLYTFIFALLPIGSYTLVSRLLALKNLSFFTLVYFIGRFCNARSVNISKNFSYICIMLIIAGIVAFGEKIMYQHIHNYTGFAEYNEFFINGEVSGNYGLVWTFETESGGKRFGSIFANPLELASSTVLGFAIILSLITYRFNKRIAFRVSNFEWVGLIASFICIIAAASRASFAGYFLLIYVYGWAIGNRRIISGFHAFFITAVIYVMFFLEGDLFDFIMNTIKFQNESSIGHILEWLDGINAMITRPLGLGIGESGRVAVALNEQTGGENQLIIIGVQAGVPMMLLYLYIYFDLIRTGLKELKVSVNKTWKVILAVVLIKISTFIPLFTSYIDSYIYLSYISWFLCGYMINLIQSKPPVPVIMPAANNN